MRLGDNIIILGPNGMLGRMAVKYFGSLGLNVVEIHERYSPENRSVFFDKLSEAGPGVVINCIGRIKQKSELLEDLVFVNSILPLDLYDQLGRDQFLIHPSTDCVFSEIRNTLNTINSKPLPSDYYGLSKRLGEVALLGRHNALIVRVSIIGPDIAESPKGLLGWFLSLNPGSEINGYTNHFWNGITTLEWCKFISDQIFNEDLRKFRDGNNLIQLGTSETFSKYELLNLFQKYFRTNHRITPIEAPVKVDRRLEPSFFCKSLEKQLLDLESFNF